MTELEFQRQLFGDNGLATMLGWLHVHWRPAKTAHGWRTLGSGPLAKGWPDHVLVRERDQRLLFVELKSDRGKLSPDQEWVLGVLRSLEQVGLFDGPLIEVHVWRPRDIEKIAEVLR